MNKLDRYGSLNPLERHFLPLAIKAHTNYNYTHLHPRRYGLLLTMFVGSKSYPHVGSSFGQIARLTDPL